MPELKQNLMKGNIVVGPFVIVSSPIMIEMAALAGMDFVILDMEHGPLDMSDVDTLCAVARGKGVEAVVRVGSNDEWAILRALDVGASGVEVPQISDRSDAEYAAKAAKYAPAGHRGVSTFTRAGAMNGRGSDYFREANAETTVIVHIEGVEGVSNLDEILSVENIDVIFLGPYDLSQSLGIPGQVDDPRVQKAIADCVQKIRSSGKFAGSFAKDVKTARKWLDLGIQYIGMSVDAGIYREACCEIVSAIRE